MTPLDFDSLWNFADPAGTERLFRERLGRREDSSDDRAQLLSQIARTQALQKRFEESLATLDEARRLLGADTPVAAIRIPLERGRVLNDTDRFDEARAAFAEALERATAIGHEPLAMDAIHMLGVLPPAAEAVAWNQRGIELAEQSENPKVHRWLGTLWLNLGLKLHELRQFPESEIAFAAMERESARLGNVPRVLLARLCLGKGYRLQGRHDEALAIQQSLLDEATGVGGPVGYACEEIAENLLALGRAVEARPFFERACSLLSADPWFPPPQRSRLVRMAELLRSLPLET